MMTISYISKERITPTVLSTIDLLRFPLIFGVLLLHTFVIGENVGGHVQYPQGTFLVLESVEYFIKRGFGDLCVPTFFVISGYLFFRKGFIDKSDYLKKMKSRIHSLLLPYLFWNTIFILFVGAVELMIPAFVGERKNIWDFTFFEWCNAYWDLSQGLIPLWYIRDLMIINIFTPVIYFFIKKTGYLMLMIFLILWLLNLFVYVNGIGLRSVMFYTIGAYLAIVQPRIPVLNIKIRLILLIFYLVLLAISAYLYFKGDNTVFINQISILYGVILLLILFVDIQNRHHFKTPSLLLRNCFFIYVFHMFVIYIPDKLLLYVLPKNSFCGISLFLLVPIITSIICICIYELIRRLSPPLSTFMVGGR